jgi:predicted lipid carrier protein YhbT
MATAEECRLALESLTGRLRDMDPADRAANLVDREISCSVEDLGITFFTHVGPDVASTVTMANGSDGQAQVRVRATRDDLVAIAEDPGSFGRAWLTGRLKVEASILDLLRLRKLL